MRSNLLATAAVLLGLSVVSSANAVVIATPASAGADAAVGFNFVAEPHGPAPVAISSPFTINGFAFGSMMGTVEVSQTTDGTGAQPLGTTGPYLSILANSSITVSFAPRTSVGFFWGSIDPGNFVTFSDGTVISGASLAPALSDSGCQTSTDCNRFITFTSSTPFSFLTLASSSNSFEVTNFAAGVPESSIWAMMMLGFLGIGLIAYRRKSDRPMIRLA